MKKSNEQLLIIGAVLVGIWALSGGTFGPQAVTQTGGAVTTDGVTVYTGTPTIEWYATDAVTGQSVSPGHFRVSINGSESEETATATANASIGDPFTICLMPNTTYYSTCESGTVEKTVVKVDVETYALGSATIWINNDPENGTARNALGAEDVLAAGDTDTPTICVQGATANASYGDGGLLFIFDFNNLQLLTAPTFSVGSLANDKVPMGDVVDVNAAGGYGGNTKVAYEVLSTLTNQQTVCGTLTVQNSATKPTGQQSFIQVEVFDRAKFRHTVNDALESAYGRPTSGADTNSATNATLVEYRSV